jgi:hypothetical protein
MQPAGIFPLVGPIFSPGKSACWTCLADRMKWNRQVKAFLDRKHAQCVTASPLSKNVLARGAVGLAAVEIAKAVASGFRTDLLHNIVSPTWSPRSSPGIMCRCGRSARLAAARNNGTWRVCRRRPGCASVEGRS